MTIDRANLPDLPGFTKEDLLGLTDPELEALVNGEGRPPELGGDEAPIGFGLPASADEAAKLAAQGVQTSTEPDKPAEAPAAQPAPAAAPGAAQQPAPAAAAPATDPNPAPAQPERPRDQPLLRTGERIKDGDAQLATIKGEKADLLKKYDAGEIDPATYATQLEALNDRQLDLRSKLERQQLADDMDLQRAQNRWNEAVYDFVQVRPMYASDVTWAAFDKAVAATVKEATDGGKQLTHAQVLEQAHAKVCAAVGIDPASTVKGGTKKADPAPAPATEPGKQGQGVTVPPSIRTLPATDATPTGDDALIADLNRLAAADPIAYERKLASLSNTQREQLDRMY